MTDPAAAARAIRAWLAAPGAGGEKMVAHIDLSRPRRGLWIETWANIPGLVRDCRTGEYSHTLLPGWSYTVQEMRTELIEDLEHLALTGEQPKAATR